MSTRAPFSWFLLTSRSAAVCAATAFLVACGGGGAGGGSGGGAGPQAPGIQPRTETLAAVSLDAREGLFSSQQTVFVPNSGIAGTFSWDVLPVGAVQASAELVSGGVQVRFSARGVPGAVGQQIEVWFCSVAPCTAENSLRRVIPLRVNVLRGLSWKLPDQVLFGGQGIALDDVLFDLDVPVEAGVLDVQVSRSASDTSPSGWLQATVQPSASAQSRVLRLSSVQTSTLPVGDYVARLRARFAFADGSAPLSLEADFMLKQRPAGCRRPEGRANDVLGVQLGPKWYGALGAGISIPIECWGVPASATTYSVEVPWLNAAVRGQGQGLNVDLSLDIDRAAALPSSSWSELQLRIASPVQQDVWIPFTMNIRFADVLSVAPASIRAGAPAEVLLKGRNLDTQLTPILFDAKGQVVAGVTLVAVRQQACGNDGCDVFVSVPPLPAGDWSIGFEQLPGVKRPLGQLRTTMN